MKDDGGGAFPVVRTDITGNRGNYMSETYSEGGMTLRDYFAAKALAACIAEPVEGVAQCVAFELSETTAADFAKAAYQFADAMIKERSK
jgi:hypothetical protein